LETLKRGNLNVAHDAAQDRRRFVTEARAAGRPALPVPRHIEGPEPTSANRISLHSFDWGLKLEGVTPDDIAVRTLLSEDGLDVPLWRDGLKPVELAVRPGTVDTGTGDARDEQAYEITVTRDAISIIGNGRAGLFYGACTFLQLCPYGSAHPCHVVDWPAFEIRCIHLDTKHHQDRMETLKRLIDQAASMKINAILYEIEDKFAYPSHPVIGAPGAWTPEQMQEMVDYALGRHVEIIPDVQGPAHMAYVLKHDEFAHLRCDGSNYQICMDEPDARRLLFDLYDDLCAATQGCRFFHVSTDEVYYAGICEKFRKPYNPENRSLTWVDYVNAAHEHITGKWGREVIVWAEYPLLAEHIEMLPPSLINGVGRDPGRLAREKERGIRHFAYVSMQGSELLFPNYFAWVDRDGELQRGRLEANRAAVIAATKHEQHPIGVITAAWDDSGLHNETFWLGWGCVAQWSWRPDVRVEETVTAFFDQFYDCREGFAAVYRLMQSQARFYENTLERLPSKERGALYGHWWGKEPVPCRDRTLVRPDLPETDNLSFEPTFESRYAAAFAELPDRLVENDRLLLRLNAFLGPHHHPQNLEAFLSIAYFVRHFLDMLLAVRDAERLLVKASAAENAGERQDAVGHLVAAHGTVRATVEDLYDMYGRLRATWELTRFEKGMSADGRDFVQVFDDVKDHTADRRADLSYLIAPEERMDLRGWLAGLRAVIESYAAKHGLAIEPPPEPELDE
jgi:hypothetical protein